MENNKSSSNQPEDVMVQTGDLSPEQKAGMQLAWSLLWIIAGVIFLYALICREHGCNQSRAPALPGATAATAACVHHNEPTWMEFAFTNLQYILHVLSPIFGTVLGFVFGTRNRG